MIIPTGKQRGRNCYTEIGRGNFWTFFPLANEYAVLCGVQSDPGRQDTESRYKRREMHRMNTCNAIAPFPLPVSQSVVTSCALRPHSTFHACLLHFPCARVRSYRRGNPHPAVDLTAPNRENLVLTAGRAIVWRRIETEGVRGRPCRLTRHIHYCGQPIFGFI